ncbi:type II 3-dehydroquinate dehydratase [bacterium]|nr:type II 3-dehydroquinate dehydratase [bacterium]
MKILVLNGPNLNLLGTRQPEIYGSETLSSIEQRLQMLAEKHGCNVTFFQSNHEGVLIDRIQAAKDFNAIVINPGGLTYSSVSLRDALGALHIPVIEVHISNIFSRERFRAKSLISPICRGVISGFGGDGYLLALQAICGFQPGT